MCDRCKSDRPTLPYISSDGQYVEKNHLCSNCRMDLGNYVEIDPEYLKAVMPWPAGEGSRLTDSGLTARIKAGLWPDMTYVIQNDDFGSRF